MSSREPGPGLRFRRVSQDARAASGSGPVPFTDRALEQLRTWPALEVSRTGNGASLRARGGAASIARLRHPDEAELCLTWPVIQRLGDALAVGGRVRIEPGSDWVAMPLQGSSDLRLLLLLMSVAIRAHAPGTDERRPPRDRPAPPGPPPDHRSRPVAQRHRAAPPCEAAGRAAETGR